MDTGFDPQRDTDETDTASGAVEIVELEVRESRSGQVTASRPRFGSLFARSVGETTMALSLRTARASLAAGRSLYRAAFDSAPGRLLTDVASGALEALGQDGSIDWSRAEDRVEEQLSRVIAIVAPVVVQSIDPEELLEYLDLDLLLEAVDVNAVLDRIDIGRLLDQVDVDALLGRVDVDGLVARVDVDALLGRVDVDGLVARVDVDALVSQVDVNAIARRAQIGELVAESTTDVAGSALDLGRRQAVALDTVLARAVSRVLGRDSNSMPPGPPALAEHEEDTT